MTTEERVLAVVSKQLGRPDARRDHNLFDDLGCDSLDHVELIMSVEEEFNVEVPDAVAEKLKTPADIVNFIDQYWRNR